MKSSATIAMDAGHPHAPLSGRGVTANLSEPIVRAVQQSGILQDHRDLTWLNDTRMIAALTYANEVHNGKTRRYGNKPRLIHEVWCAHNVYNDAKLKTWLAQEKLDPMLGAFSAALHDTLENSRDQAKKANAPFKGKEVLSRIAGMWGNAQSIMPIIYCVKYMTDAPDLHGTVRIQAQKDKSFDAEGKCKVSPLKQAIRAYDKLSHVAFDAREYALGNIPASKAQECLSQAHNKAFVFSFPYAQLVKPRYMKATRQLALEVLKSQQLAQPLPEVPANDTNPSRLLLAAAFAYNAQMILFSAQNMNKIWEIGQTTITLGVKAIKSMGFDL